MLLRNREIARALTAGITISLIACIATFLTVSGLSPHSSTASAHLPALAAGGCVLATGLALTALFLYTTRQRYRELSNLATKLDAVLAGDRTIDFLEMNEGELAILSNELDKVITRLNLTVDELQNEKLALADALADISHQLKTPLTSIALSTELVCDRLAESGDPANVLGRMRLVQRLQGRVEDLVAALLKLARIDAGVIQLVQAPVDAAKLVSRAFEPLAIAFDIADVTFESDVQPGAGYTGDLAWSVEALENILKNCMEYTPAGGHVRVHVTEDILACRIYIEDSGPGISEADLPHIFERFYRGTHASENSEVNPAGVGIGLALAKSLVVAQGGTIHAETLRNTDGTPTGAAFTLTFFKAIV